MPNTHTIRQDMINESVLQQEEEEGWQDGRELPVQDNPRTPDTCPRADLPSWTTISSALIESSSLQDELGEFISPPPKKRVQRISDTGPIPASTSRAKLTIPAKPSNTQSRRSSLPVRFTRSLSKNTRQKEVFDAVEIEIRTRSKAPLLLPKSVFGQNGEASDGAPDYSSQTESTRIESDADNDSQSILVSGTSSSTTPINNGPRNANSNTVFTALSHTFSHNAPSSLSFSISNERVVPPQGSRKSRGRKAEIDVDSLLNTNVAPMTICVRSDGGVERRELGPIDLDIENSVFGGESNSIEARESRLAMNIRFLGSKPAVDIDMNDVDAKIDERERPPSLSEGIRGWGIDVAREGAVPAGSQYTVTHLRKTSNRMFVERMEEIFGTAGSMGSGSGGKPKENHQYAHPPTIHSNNTGAPSSTTTTMSIIGTSHSRSPISMSVSRRRDVSTTDPSSIGDEVFEDYFEDSKTVGAEDHVCTMEKAGVAPSLDQIELWASALQILNKGKVRMGREDMQSIREVLECISEAKDDFDPSMLEETSLWSMMTQLCTLEDSDIPYGDEYDFKKRAQSVVSFWRDKFA